MDFEKAIEFIKQKHNGQKRKQGTPYYTHPVAVAELLKEKGFSLEYQIAGLFHDLLEDTDATIEEIINSKDYSTGGDNSYAGIYNKPIDCIKIKSTKGYVTYRVHVKGGNWLPWVDSRIETGTESYAGIYGKEIDGIQMY